MKFVSPSSYSAVPPSHGCDQFTTVSYLGDGRAQKTFAHHAKSFTDAETVATGFYSGSGDCSEVNGFPGAEAVL